MPTGLDEDVVRTISSMKNEPEWLLDFRLKAFAHWKNSVELLADLDYKLMTSTHLLFIAPKKFNKDEIPKKYLIHLKN